MSSLDVTLLACRRRPRVDQGHYGKVVQDVADALGMPYAKVLGVNNIPTGELVHYATTFKQLTTSMARLRKNEGQETGAALPPVYFDH